MSNILTSYVRIYPKNGQSIPHDKQLWMLKNIVTWRGEFDSYYVRIWMHWNSQERCLDIQYGSGKSSWHFYEELLNDYYVWERIADEGGWSDTLRYHNDESYEDCIYGFDAMLVDKSVSQNSISNLAREIVGENYLVTVNGEYTASNDLSCVDDGEDDDDLVSLYYSEPDYLPGKNVYGEIKLLTPLELNDLIYCKNGITDCFLKLQWKGRTVYQRSFQPTEDEPEGEWIKSCRDTWDNVLNEFFLEFKAKIYSGSE